MCCVNNNCVLLQLEYQPPLITKTKTYQMYTYTTHYGGVRNNFRFYCNNMQSSSYTSYFHTLTHMFDWQKCKTKEKAPHLGASLQLLGLIHPTLNE